MNRRPPYIAAPLILALCLLALLLRSPRLEAEDSVSGLATTAQAMDGHRAPDPADRFVGSDPAASASVAITCGAPRPAESSGTGVLARRGGPAAGALPLRVHGLLTPSSRSPSPDPLYLTNHALLC